MNRLKTDKRKAVIAALVDGCSINAIVQMTGVSKVTILKLLRVLGCACAAHHDNHVRGLTLRSIQCDEVWSFKSRTQKGIATTKLPDISRADVWTWTALEPDSRLMISYLVGTRSAGDAFAFLNDISGRVINFDTLTIEGCHAPPEALRAAFNKDFADAQLKQELDGPTDSEFRYLPASSTTRKEHSAMGPPEADNFSTGQIERVNPKTPTLIRRSSELSNDHDKKIENHGHAFALFVAYYNYCRMQPALSGKTPAIAAGLADHVWTIDELLGK